MVSIYRLVYGNTSANELIAQLSNYSLKVQPYDFEFVPELHSVKNWWLMCKQKKQSYTKISIND
jgi:hypothetical protein